MHFHACQGCCQSQSQPGAGLDEGVPVAAVRCGDLIDVEMLVLVGLRLEPPHQDEAREKLTTAKLGPQQAPGPGCAWLDDARVLGVVVAGQRRHLELDQL